MQRVIVTGANGFTGRYLIELLAAQGYLIHGLTNRLNGSEPKKGSQISWHECDLTEPAQIKQCLDAICPDKIVHLAAISFVAQENIETIYRTNIIGTRNLLEAASSCDKVADCVILASSANIYGNQAGGILGEDTAPAPTNDYAVSKLATEYVGRLYSNRLPIIVTRPFNYTGLGQNVKFLIPKIVDHIRRRKTVIELGNLDVARDFSDVRAVVAAYASLIRSEAAIGGTYNICSGRAYSLKEVIEMAQSISGHSIGVTVNPSLVRQNEVRTLCGDRTKLDTTIPGLPNPPLAETLRWMLQA